MQERICRNHGCFPQETEAAAAFLPAGQAAEAFYQQRRAGRKASVRSGKRKEKIIMEIGIKGHRELMVTEDLLACRIGSGSVKVFATPVMVAEIETAAVDSIAKFLPEGKTTVGTLVNVQHVAATPAGMKVRVETELTGISENGKILTFHVEAYDGKGLIGVGTHERAIVTKEHFEARALAKLGEKA